MRQGGWDFFQGRAIWPIKDAGGLVLGFGARKLFDDDRMPAKYLNTPETPVYKKSHVLYGLDLARTNIGKKSQAVIVEGYTDVMAAHVAGVDTAVASWRHGVRRRPRPSHPAAAGRATRSTAR